MATNPETGPEANKAKVIEQTALTFDEDKVVIEAQYQNMCRFGDARRSTSTSTPAPIAPAASSSNCASPLPEWPRATKSVCPHASVLVHEGNPVNAVGNTTPTRSAYFNQAALSRCTVSGWAAARSVVSPRSWARSNNCHCGGWALSPKPACGRMPSSFRFPSR